MSANGDHGLQPERTKLSWDRTLLACGVGAVLAVRILAPLGVAGALIAGAGALATVAVAAGARIRHRRVLRVFPPLGSGAMPGGALLLGLTALVSGGAAAFLLLAALRR